MLRVVFPDSAGLSPFFKGADFIEANTENGLATKICNTILKLRRLDQASPLALMYRGIFSGFNEQRTQGSDLAECPFSSQRQES